MSEVAQALQTSIVAWDGARGRTSMTTVLLVDDEANIVELIQGYLEREGFDVLDCADGVSALDLARTRRPDLVVLDVMLPALDGVEVCRRLRQFSEAYVLMLSVRADEIDKLVGLAVGADDYLTKPFSPRELVARVKALLRRPRGGASHEPPPAPVHQFGPLVLDMGRQEVTHHNEVVALTTREFQLLATLAAHPGHVFTRAQLLERVWGNAYYDDHIVDVHVANVRKKLLEDAASPQYLQTVRGIGYRFNPPRR